MIDEIHFSEQDAEVQFCWRDSRGDPDDIGPSSPW